MLARALAIFLPILAALPTVQQARAEDGPSAYGDAPPEHAAKWHAPQPAEAKILNKQAAEPARVRIGLRLTPFKKVTTRGRDGSIESRWVPMEPLRHTLRARLNKNNHFFVGDYHLETKPTKWVRKSRRYEVAIDVYRRYGAFGQLEEFLGTTTLIGVLEEQENNLFVVYGVARKRLRDKMQSPVLDIVAGFQPGTAQGPNVSQKEKPARTPAAMPAGQGALIRGRF